MHTVLFLLLLISYTYGYGRHMPDYIKPCSKSNIATCALESARAAYPTIVKGDPEFDIPNLSPLHFPELEVDAGENLVLKFNNLIVEGMEHLDIKKVEFDLENKKAFFECYGKILYFQGHYEGGGKVYVMTLQGSGNSNITFVGGTYTYSFAWDIKNINGEDHLVLKDPKMKFKLTRAHFDFENLEGKDLQGEKVNTLEVLNDNWDMIIDEVGDQIANTIEKVITEIISGYFEHIPESEMFA
ncbi:unnamed protein product [Brassicogethes aeneus]|uniref:Uncharacterized protein n=1 Tax=Brassicogethes aeneus TaxID=1431903 RepID=A0A9P0B110_BRAAE|nr:unnamed protein product [Brassicogethes aeneus]